MENGTVINVLYFAQVAELTGIRLENWPLNEPTTGEQWLNALEQKYPQLAPTRRLKLAVNQFHVKPSAVINPGDEVAVFEPVTGG